MYQQWHKHLELNMDDYLESEFWDIIYQEYGAAEDLMTDNITEIITPQRGIIILITKEFYNGQEPF